MSAMLGNASSPRVHSDMEIQIHQIEQEAYFAVLRAFKAQADAISWVSAMSSFCFHYTLGSQSVYCFKQFVSFGLFFHPGERRLDDRA